MPRYKITIEYEGTSFHGWQRQNGFSSVQQAIENAITKLSQEVTTCHGAGRTDRGVHATGQVAHFDLNKNFPPHIIVSGLNFHLIDIPVVILNAEVVDENFHARFSAKKRSYHYIIVSRRAPLIIERNRAWQLPSKLDIVEMQKAANYIIGHHDFTSFRALECQGKSPMKTLEKLTIEQISDHIYFHFTAPSFLHHMVRNIVGTLKLIGEKKWLAEHIITILESKNRKLAGPTAPAHGLYLNKIEYEE